MIEKYWTRGSDAAFANISYAGEVTIRNSTIGCL